MATADGTVNLNSKKQFKPGHTKDNQAISISQGELMNSGSSSKGQ